MLLFRHLRRPWRPYVCGLFARQSAPVHHSWRWVSIKPTLSDHKWFLEVGDVLPRYCWKILGWPCEHVGQERILRYRHSIRWRCLLLSQRRRQPCHYVVSRWPLHSSTLARPQTQRKRRALAHYFCRWKNLLNSNRYQSLRWKCRTWCHEGLNPLWSTQSFSGTIISIEDIWWHWGQEN